MNFGLKKKSWDSALQAQAQLVVKEHKLSNGLAVWLNEDHSQPKVFGAVVVRAGAKDSPNTGIAHYFEHIMFKGNNKIGTTNYEAEKVLLDSIAVQYDLLAQTQDATVRATIQKKINEISIRAAEYAIPNEFNRLITKYGGSGLNAGTSYDDTQYFNTFSPAYIKQWIEIAGERFINPAFRLFQSELETVYEEKNMYSDRMETAAMQKAMELFFSPHPYIYPIIGSTENLKNPQLSLMNAFYKKYYVASNMGLILSGDFDAKEIIPLIEASFSRIPAGTAPLREMPQPSSISGVRKEQIKIPIPFIKARAWAWRGVPAGHPDEAALEIAIGLLNNANGTGFLDKLIVDGKAMMVQAMSMSLNDAGALALIVVPNMLSLSSGPTVKAVKRAIERIKQGDFSNEVFNSLKLNQKRGFQRQLESIDGRTEQMRALFSRGESWEKHLQTGAGIDALSKQDIVQIARKYFNDNYFEFIKKAGRYPKEQVSKPNYAPIPVKNSNTESAYAQGLEKMPVQKAESRTLDFEKDAQTIALSPLATLYLSQNNINQLFTLRFDFGVSTLERPTLPQLATYLQFLGTDQLSYEQFRGALQNLGATLFFDTGANNFTMSVSGFDAQFEETLQLSLAFLKNAKANQKKLKSVIDNKNVENKSFFKSSNNTIAALMHKTLYGDESKYLRQLSLSETKKLKGAELIHLFHEVTQTECTIHYCGSLLPESVVNIIKNSRITNNITTPSRAPLFSQAQAYQKPNVFFVDDPKATQTIIYGYIQGPAQLSRKDRCMAHLFNSYFGGGMSSLMFQEIRELRSFAYGARSSLLLPEPKNREKNSSFIAILSTQNDKAPDAMQLLDSLLQNMPLQEGRLEYAKQNMANNISNSYPGFRDISARIAAFKQDGYTQDPYPEFLATLETLQLFEIDTFYKDNIQGKPITWMLVGNSKKLNMVALAKFGQIVHVKHNEIYKK